MSDRDTDYAVAERVMGRPNAVVFPAVFIRADADVPYYTTDATADLAALARARSWHFSKRQAFYRALDATWQSRVGLTSGEREAYPDVAARYQPGDYARAALLVQDQTEAERAAMFATSKGRVSKAHDGARDGAHVDREANHYIGPPADSLPDDVAPRDALLVRLVEARRMIGATVSALGEPAPNGGRRVRLPMDARLLYAADDLLLTWIDVPTRTLVIQVNGTVD